MARDRRIVVPGGAALDLDLNENLLQKWIVAYGEDAAHSFQERRRNKPEDLGALVLKLEIRKLRV